MKFVNVGILKQLFTICLWNVGSNSLGGSHVLSDVFHRCLPCHLVVEWRNYTRLVAGSCVSGNTIVLFTGFRKITFQIVLGAGGGLSFTDRICILICPKNKNYKSNSGGSVGKFHKTMQLHIKSAASMSVAFAQHNTITQFGYFVISEAFCIFPCVWVRGGNFTVFLFYLRLLPTSFCNVFVIVRLGLLSLYAIRPSAVFLARLCWYCWFHRASSSPLIVGSLVPGSVTAGWGVWAAWHSPHRASNGAEHGLITGCSVLLYSVAPTIMMVMKPMTEKYSSGSVSLVLLAEYIQYLTLQAYSLLHVPPGLTFSNSTFCRHSVFMYFVRISEQTAIISLYSIN